VEENWDPIDKANRKVLDFVKLKIGNETEPKKEKAREQKVPSPESR
jgi:hypothetical protein